MVRPLESELDEALQSFPEIEDYPLDLYIQLFQNPGPVSKRAALITKEGDPVSIACVREKDNHWEPFTQWLLPGTIFPVKHDYLLPTLEVLGLDLWVGCWRWNSPPPASRLIRYLEAVPTYRMSCTSDFESYWRSTKTFKSIRKARNHCRNFSVAINHPGSAEWTIRNWETKWRVDPTQESNDLADKIFIANYLEKIGLFFTFSILDEGEIIAGATVIVHKNDLVAGVIYRKPEYDWYGVGDYVIDCIFQWASKSNYRTFDIGGVHNYKEKWAPQEGTRWSFHLCPEYLYRTKQVYNWLRNSISFHRGGEK